MSDSPASELGKRQQGLESRSEHAQLVLSRCEHAQLVVRSALEISWIDCRRVYWLVLTEHKQGT